MLVAIVNWKRNNCCLRMKRMADKGDGVLVKLLGEVLSFALFETGHATSSSS